MRRLLQLLAATTLMIFAAVPFAAGVPARAETPVVQWTPYSDSSQGEDIYGWMLSFTTG